MPERTPAGEAEGMNRLQNLHRQGRDLSKEETGAGGKGHELYPFPAASLPCPPRSGKANVRERSRPPGTLRQEPFLWGKPPPSRKRAVAPGCGPGGRWGLGMDSSRRETEGAIHPVSRPD